MSTYIPGTGGNFVPAITALQQHWFAVHTCSRYEKQVAAHCEARGIEYFLPVYEEVHRWSDRRVTIQAPLFPGYVFTRISPQARLAVLQVPGVAHIVSFGGVPAPVSASEIESLKRGASCGIRIEPHPYLKVGCRVRVCGGPMRGIEGILVQKKDSVRVVISVDLIMRSVAVEIDPADLKVIA